MTIEVTTRKLLIAFAIISYPLNLAMMKYGNGIYSNDPDRINGQSNTGKRVAAFVASPVVMPISATYWLVQNAVTKPDDQIQIPKERQ